MTKEFASINITSPSVFMIINQLKGAWRGGLHSRSLILLKFCNQPKSHPAKCGQREGYGAFFARDVITGEDVVKRWETRQGRGDSRPRLSGGAKLRGSCPQLIFRSTLSSCARLDSRGRLSPHGTGDASLGCTRPAAR